MRAGLIFLVLILVGRAEEVPNPQDYPTAISPIDRFVKAAIPDVHSYSRCIRDLRYDRPATPDFADHYSMCIAGCGSGCAEFCVIDRRTGHVFPGFSFGGGPQFQFTRTSRLVGVLHTDGMYSDEDEVYADYYVWKSDHFSFVGRWVTTYGAVQKKHPTWSRRVTFEPNLPVWRDCPTALAQHL